MERFLLILILLVFRSYLCMARDTLLSGESLSGSQTLVSNNGLYELGLSNRYSYDDSFYLGIWLVNVSDNFLWIANGDNPIYWIANSVSIWQESLDWELRIYSTDLVLTYLQSFIWSSISTRGEAVTVSTVLVLLDSGNLVLRDSKNSFRIVWQSFNHPTNTWFPGAPPLEFNNHTTKNIVLTYGWGSRTTYLEIDPSHTHYGFIIKGEHRMGVLFPHWMNIQEINGTHVVITFDHPKQHRLFLQLSSQQISILYRVDNPNDLMVLWSATGHGSFCDSNSFCGPNSLCSKKGHCSCPYGFKQFDPFSWEHGYYPGGCSRLDVWNCEIGSNSSDEFHLIDYLSKLPDKPEYLLLSGNKCETACSRNCSCSAYSYDGDCKLWFGELRNIIMQDPGEVGGLEIKLRVKVRVGVPILQGKRVKHHKTIIMLVTGALTLFGFVLILCWKNMKSFIVGQLDEENFLKVFSYAEIKKITKNFSDKLGEGGFGSVFRGALSHSAIVAVKKMKTSLCEEKQFRAEVQTIGLIQHTNLVRLVGLCSEGNKRLLVYEYMPNGSLDSHLFSDNRHGLSLSLSWNTRYHIMLGIARGLAYLHQDCINCIIHCDIKPENVLLDADFCPKIADFGMAKLLARDFSRALTTMRGTIGYLAPEWISGQPITQKADVYSFGMMVFEIISGRRNINKLKIRECTYFPLYAAIKVNQGDISCLLDNRLEENANMEELNIACKVACWCIQERETDRPSMRQVVQMLEGAVEVLMPPVPSFLQRIVDIENDSVYSE